MQPAVCAAQSICGRGAFCAQGQTELYSADIGLTTNTTSNIITACACVLLALVASRQDVSLALTAGNRRRDCCLSDFSRLLDCTVHDCTGSLRDTFQCIASLTQPCLTAYCI